MPEFDYSPERLIPPTVIVATFLSLVLSPLIVPREEYRLSLIGAIFFCLTLVVLGWPLYGSPQPDPVIGFMFAYMMSSLVTLRLAEDAQAMAKADTYADWRP